MKLILWITANDLRTAVKGDPWVGRLTRRMGRWLVLYGSVTLDCKRQIRLLVVDDHEVVRDGLADLLTDSKTQVVGKAGTADDAIQMALSLSPSVVLMDVRMDDFDGLWALEQLKQAVPHLPVVLFSSYDNPTYVARAIALGASDYLLKSASRAEILQTLTSAIEGGAAPAESLLSRVRKTMEADKKSPVELGEYMLTTREVQVLRHVGLGLSNKEIAKSLSISVETVKEHVQNILRKTKAADRTDAAVKAIRWGVVC